MKNKHNFTDSTPPLNYIAATINTAVKVPLPATVNAMNREDLPILHGCMWLSNRQSRNLSETLT
jgi:hypothetical protein